MPAVSEGISNLSLSHMLTNAKDTYSKTMLSSKEEKGGLIKDSLVDDDAVGIDDHALLLSCKVR